MLRGGGGAPYIPIVWCILRVGGGQKGVVVRCEVESVDQLDSFAILVIETNLLC